MKYRILLAGIYGLWVTTFVGVAGWALSIDYSIGHWEYLFTVAWFAALGYFAGSAIE